MPRIPVLFWQEPMSFPIPPPIPYLPNFQYNIVFLVPWAVKGGENQTKNREGVAASPHHCGSGRHRAGKALRMRRAGRQKDREDVEEQEEEEGGGGGEKMASTGEAKPGRACRGLAGGLREPRGVGRQPRGPSETPLPGRERRSQRARRVGVGGRPLEGLAGGGGGEEGRGGKRAACGEPPPR